MWKTCMLIYWRSCDCSHPVISLKASKRSQSSKQEVKNEEIDLHTSHNNGNLEKVDYKAMHSRINQIITVGDTRYCHVRTQPLHDHVEGSWSNSWILSQIGRKEESSNPSPWEKWGKAWIENIHSLYTLSIYHRYIDRLVPSKYSRRDDRFNSGDVG